MIYKGVQHQLHIPNCYQNNCNNNNSNNNNKNNNNNNNKQKWKDFTCFFFICYPSCVKPSSNLKNQDPKCRYIAPKTQLLC